MLNVRSLTLVALVVLIAIAPLFFPSGYYYRVGALIFINALAVIGIAILLGYAGQVSLGQAGFLGIGAYACAILPARYGLPPVLALVVGAVISGLVAWAVGRPILKLRGYYLAVATLGFGFLVSMILNNEAWLTGGPDGMAVADLGLKDLLAVVGVKTKTSTLWYWFSGAVLVLGALIALNLHDSPSGRILRAVHDSEIAASTIGVDVARAKLLAFVVSAVYASVAGSLLALFNQFITPDAAGFLHSVELVTMAVLGGAASVFGAVVGSAVLTALPQALTVFQHYEHMVLGAVMMLVMIFMRQGLVPSLAALLRGRRA